MIGQAQAADRYNLIQNEVNTGNPINVQFLPLEGSMPLNCAYFTYDSDEPRSDQLTGYTVTIPSAGPLFPEETFIVPGHQRLSNSLSFDETCRPKVSKHSLDVSCYDWKFKYSTDGNFIYFTNEHTTTHHYSDGEDYEITTQWNGYCW